MSDRFLDNCKKIGIMGGTFNPIHIGHLLMAKWAKEFADLDAVIFIPTGNSYMKNSSEILDGNTRMDMVRLSISEEEGFFASEMEIERSGNTYTWETMQELSRIYPEAELYFIIGADSLYNFERWVHPERILKKCTLIAAARNGAKTAELNAKIIELQEKFGGEILLMDFPAFDVSSTMIRSRIRDGKSIRYLTADKVCDYIGLNKLYL